MPAKPSVYDELYPGRFLKAGLFKGVKPTLTIKDVDVEELIGDDNKPKQKAILSFAERPMQHVMCKTNGLCLKAMFGPILKDWVGKRVTLFAGQWNGEECIRVWGSPDIASDINVTITLPRRKPFDMRLHAVKKGAVVTEDKTSKVDPRIMAAFELLEMDQNARDNFIAGRTDEEVLAELNRLIDEQNAA